MLCSLVCVEVHSYVAMWREYIHRDNSWLYGDGCSLYPQSTSWNCSCPETRALAIRGLIKPSEDVLPTNFVLGGNGCGYRFTKMRCVRGQSWFVDDVWGRCPVFDAFHKAVNRQHICINQFWISCATVVIHVCIMIPCLI